MRSRAVNNDQRSRCDRELSNDIEEAAIKASSFSSLGRFDSDGENSINRKRWIAVLCLGIVVGAFLSSLMTVMNKPAAAKLEHIHRNVKNAYRAHNLARKEYLKSYRKAYLESILSDSTREVTTEDENSTKEVTTADNGNEELDQMKTENHDSGDSLTPTSADDDAKMKSESNSNSDRGGAEGVNESQTALASTDGTIVFRTLENGEHVCLPLIDEGEFHELVVEEGNDGSGALISRAECEWYNNVKKVGLETSAMPSDCVPDKHVFLTLTNEHDFDMLIFGLQHVISKSCFTDRLIVLCLDENAETKCRNSGFKHCIQYVKSLGAADFMKGDYKQIVWLKPKMALVLLNAGLSLFTLDSDILFFRVPDLAKVTAANPDAELFHQWEKVDYEQLYAIPNRNEDFEETVLHEGYNSGQVLWLPTERVINGTLRSLLLGKREGGGRLEQQYTEDGMRNAGVVTSGLSFMYAGNWECQTKGGCYVGKNGQNWTSYHATWVIGHEMKMEVLKKAQEGWENLMIADEVQTKDFILEKKENYLAAMRYFQCTQTDKEAERHVVKLGVGGGIGSMLAVAWSELLKSKVEAQKHVAVTFEGDLKWYTSNEGCKQNPGYECFFLDPAGEGHVNLGDANSSNNNNPTSSCEERFGKEIFLPIKMNQFWWGVTNAYMFAPKPNILAAADMVREQFDFTDFPDVALHIRRGDKLQDGASRQTVSVTVEEYFEVAEKLIIKVAASKSSEVLVYIATDDKEATTTARTWEARRGGASDLNFKLIMQETTIIDLEGTQLANSGNQLASDRKYSEALLFLVDMHFMMHCTYFVGLIMSQPARMVVDIGFAKGTMLNAIAMDEENVENGLDKDGWNRLCKSWRGKSEVLSKKEGNDTAVSDAVDDVPHAPRPAECSNSLNNGQDYGFGNKFLVDDMKDELNIADGSPGYRKSAWHPLYWETDENYISFWNMVSSNGKLKEHLIVAAELNEQCAFEPKTGNASVEQDTQKIAAVHFRCSDVPISYAEDYPLAPPEYSSFIGKKFREWGIKRVVPLLCVEHHVQNKDERQKQCDELFNLQLNIIKREMTTNDDVIYFDDVTCLSEKTTLMAIRDLGASAILVPSSFTFPAGLARKDASKCIMPHTGLKGVSAADVLLQSKLSEEIILRMQHIADAMPVTMFCPRCGNDIEDTPEGAEKWDISVVKPLLEKYARNSASPAAS